MVKNSHCTIKIYEWNFQDSQMPSHRKTLIKAICPEETDVRTKYAKSLTQKVGILQFFFVFFFVNSLNLLKAYVTLVPKTLT